MRARLLGPGKRFARLATLDVGTGAGAVVRLAAERQRRRKDERGSEPDVLPAEPLDRGRPLVAEAGVAGGS